MNAPSDMPTSPVFPSRLPNVGTTIFTVMSALAAEKGAVNLGQGFPDFDCDPRIVDAVAAAMRSGHNQYPPMAGVAPLREAIADRIAQLYGRRYDAGTEITVTAGATQALLTAILCAVHPGDEVIVVEPTYDSYLPSIELAGGKPVFVTLEAPDYTIPFDRLAAAITPNTRMILINTPHNPTGTVWREADMRKLEDIVRGTNVLILSDEVYEHMVYDGERHESVARYPELAARSFIVSSFGKTYHVTGWKVGYVAAPAALTAEFRKVHQFNVFTVNTPMQIGLADYLRDPAPYLTLAGFYQNKRDFFRAGLERTRFKLLPCSGTYFQCVDYSAISDLPEAEFSKWLTSEIGVAAIPVSAFYHEPHESGVVRFCFAKQESTLATALERLARL
ncbi:TPA: pyridoxal phosphate-dependent aminotransferase [Burkholderia multivorans]|uniref:pyridoxal phosphate-dependent aminotransferase n=1 Tax=Burkholderia multivorans TaxID=87883 RepID=UPI001C234DFE|nr:pyridoxal phosphate-dependent aminotransferase [Burkholderia multivorans]MBU9353706.1 pyridoxal phosphate-dependent aminotransferase [Burkholderia multivorans]MBU9396929.1 pyridoxal phosphate-dependent aminotransferase [Burkholderia multivorans]HDR9838723.1 pyridoxal phosphate-dependent aminotransferase [Burkholderia multivorans]HDR9841373.1 pyridoxal phosphate-dependent aminotransferase [Burkholderia multivorans]HDR9847761.1 pyridoxal phosphate-dependent aminotransferase [Burkholderia mult